MNHIKQICKDPVKVDHKLQGKEFLLGKYFTLKSNCDRCNKDKKFPSSKRQKLLQIQHNLNRQQLNSQSKIQINQKTFNQIQPEFQNEAMHPKEEPQSNLMIDEQNSLKQKNHESQMPVSYEYFIPLHKLWKAYIQDLTGFQKNQQSLCLKLLRSDFVGAQIQVVYSKVASYIGKSGIIIKETLKSFVIVQKPKDDALKNQKTQYLTNGKGNNKKFITILKNQIIFRLKCGQKHYLLNGNTLVYRPSDRSKHKFKFRISEKLNLNFLGNFTDDSNE